MKVAVKCFATLADGETCDYKGATEYDVSEGAQVGELIQKLDIPDEQVKIVFINGRKGDPSTVLKEGDRVGLAPAVGGM
jgi:molybdopterin converting factor small subunit